jgi:hypothetical protein
MRHAAAVAAAVAVVFAMTLDGDAHKGVTSKFTYNADVYPVFLHRCGRCHIDGGVGGMSLLKYEEAFPWAESLRAELVTAHPNTLAEGDSEKADPHDFVKAAHRQISARELNIVLDWATGGTPEGDKSNTPAPATLMVDWASGRPDLIAPMPVRYQMDPAALEATQEFVLPLSLQSPVTVSRIDLLPGSPAIVRSAVLSLRWPDGTARVLGTWVPRQVPSSISMKPAVRIEPGVQIVARMHYKKTWKYEGQPMSDLSSIGLYFAD